MCKKLAFLLAGIGLAFCLGTMGSVAKATTIEWISDWQDEDANGVVDDAQWTDWLRAQGFTVNVRTSSTNTTYWRNGTANVALTAEMLGYLNAADIIIISRCTTSTDYADGDLERASWNSVTKPIINLSGGCAQNNRMEWLNNATQNNFLPVPLKVLVPSHPIFTGITLDASSQVQILDPAVGFRPAAPTTTAMMTTLSTADAGNGTLLGQRADSTSYVWIAEYKAGVSFYNPATAANTPLGKRMIFFAGTNQVTSGVTPLVCRSMLNLNANGQKIFLNAIRYLCGLPLVQGVASNPSPADKATDVIRPVVLGWKAGVYAAKHNVYFGTNQADVNTASVSTPKGVLVSPGQDANTFSVGQLTLGQTYYWRVDEVNAPPTNSTIFTGQLWSFTVEPVAYPVTGITATASSSDTGLSPTNTINSSGLTGDLLGTDATTMWLSAKGATGSAWLQYDLGKIYKLQNLWVWNYNIDFEFLLGMGIKNATIQYSSDATNWKTLGSFDFAQGPSAAGYDHNTTVPFAGAAARYVKITANSSWGGGAQYGLGKVRFYYLPVSARQPSPATGSTGIAADVTLSWRAGREAVSHQVYLSTDPNNLTLAGTSATNSFAPANLNLGTTYSWRVDEVNMAATPTTWASDVWSFTTAPFITIDDMESYNDTTNQMFNVWVDGYGTTTNGAQVGLTTSANGTYGSTTIFHSGKQSMPFYYTNTTAPISEATRTFAPVQDWTVHGADTLSLWTEGVPASFVDLNNGVILMNGTGTDIWNAGDQCRFAYKQLSGDGSIIVKVESVDNTDTASPGWSKAGVMIRPTVDTGAAEASNVLSATQGVSFQYRPTSGAATANTAAAPTTMRAPWWVKLTRTGDVFTAAQSADGVTWTPITPATAGASTVVMPKSVLIGLTVTSHMANVVCGARFSNITTTGTVTGSWTLADVGIAQLAGNGLDTLYVAIADSVAHRAVVNADPYTIVGGTWQQWKIPLSALSSAGVKLNSIKTMTIGVGDKTKAPSGAKGTLYIDDIQFGHPGQ